jgi:tetratricopeptide (TPR) repeat protein
MKRLMLLAVLLTAAGCAALYDRDGNTYENPFYAKYLNTGSQLDAQINATLAALRDNPNSPRLHNDLGSLLVRKGFPKDAEREFERAVNLDSNFYPAWYNLGLVRAARGDALGARRAFYQTIDEKPGHAAALFQLGLIEEGRGQTERAVQHYAKAYGINPSLLRVDVNPRILDSKLTHLALIELYPTRQTRNSMQFQGTPSGYQDPPARLEAPSPEAPPEKIITPAPPPTDPSQQPKPPAATTT